VLSFYNYYNFFAFWFFLFCFVFLFFFLFFFFFSFLFFPFLSLKVLLSLFPLLNHIAGFFHYHILLMPPSPIVQPST
jgi:hypothetical protein